MSPSSSIISCLHGSDIPMIASACSRSVDVDMMLAWKDLLGTDLRRVSGGATWKKRRRKLLTWTSAKAVGALLDQLIT